MNREFARKALGHYFPHLSEAWKVGLKTHLKGCNDPLLDLSTRAAIMNDIAIGCAKQLLDKANLHYFHLEAYRSKMVVVPDVAVLIFKKLDSSLCPSCYPTGRARALYSQEGLSEMPEFPRLVVGAVVNSDWTGITGVYVVNTSSMKKHNWYLDITDGLAKVEPEFEAIIDENEDIGTHFTPKKSDAAKRKAGGADKSG